MKDKICIITGATSGIGKVTAKVLAQQGAHLVLICRDEDKGEKVRKEIIRATGNFDIDLVIADLSIQHDIHDVIDIVHGAYTKVDVLINNAGLIVPEKVITPDGVELTFAVNYLSHFILTNRLIDMLYAAPEARIINVASEARRMGKINFDDLKFEKKYSAIKAYAQSKLANLLFTHQLSKKLRNTTITVNAVHPGTVDTGFGRDFKGGWKVLLKLSKPLMRKPEKGAETIIWLAGSDEVKGISGKYFFDKKEIIVQQNSFSDEIAENLWNVSMKLTGLEI